MRPALTIVALWPLWAISWFGTAWWVAPTEKKVDSHRELAYRVVLAVGSVALFIPAHGYQGPLRLWHVGWIGAWRSTRGLKAPGARPLAVPFAPLPRRGRGAVAFA